MTASTHEHLSRAGLPALTFPVFRHQGPPLDREESDCAEAGGNATQGSSPCRPGFVRPGRSQPLFPGARVERGACQLHRSRARLLASPPFQKHGSFCLFLQAVTSSPSPGLQACPDSPPRWAAPQRNFPELTLLFPGHEAQVNGRSSDPSPAALPGSRPAPAVTQPQWPPAVFSSPGSLTQLPLPLSSLPPTPLPHPALGPSPWPQEVCLGIVLHSQH